MFSLKIIFLSHSSLLLSPHTSEKKSPVEQLSEFFAVLNIYTQLLFISNCFHVLHYMDENMFEFSSLLPSSREKFIRKRILYV